MASPAPMRKLSSLEKINLLINKLQSATPAAQNGAPSGTPNKGGKSAAKFPSASAPVVTVPSSAPKAASSAVHHGVSSSDVAWEPEVPPGHTEYSWWADEDGAPSSASAANGAKPAAAATPAPAAAPAQGKAQPNKGDPQQKQQQPKKEQQPKQQAQPAGKGKDAAPESKIDFSKQPPFTRLEFKVGKIVSAELHPNAEKMYVEQIDLGEGRLRQICSGLRGRVPLESLPGSLCVVVPNLKTAKLRNLDSQGMILASSSDDDVQAALVLPPAGSKIGERVFITGQPEAELSLPTENDIDGKKEGNAFGLVAPDLKTNSKGEVCYKGTPLITSAGVLTSALRDCKVK